ncbi:MAG: MBL fold metallo-hydrolase [Oscillospiraceae bacterium]|nr:MBL fold metallo-hydrolase [Oscillospiraceae bacterium]
MKIIHLAVGLLGTNCYIIAAENDSCVIIDPGAQPDKIAGIVEENGLSPKFILLTHGHHDHIGGVKKLMSLFPEAGLKIGADDLEMLSDSQKSLAVFRYGDDAEFLIGSASNATEGDILSADGLEFRVISVPGHTKGGVAYLCGDALFTGDTLFREDVGRTDLYGGDYNILRFSLAKLAALQGDYVVYPGHGEFSTLDYERANNPYLSGKV